MFTDRFISRPVLAIAINVLLLVAGLAALASLQIRQFPRMQFTVITVTTVYTGASADLVQGFVTQPMQEQIAAADGVDYLTSESRSGQSTITVYMRLDYDPPPPNRTSWPRSRRCAATCPMTSRTRISTSAPATSRS